MLPRFYKSLSFNCIALLQRRISGCANDSSAYSKVSSRSPCLTHRFRQPEIQGLNLAVRCDLDVSRFQIAVNDPFRVCGFSRRTHGGIWSHAWKSLFRVRKSKMPTVLYVYLAGVY